MALRAYAQSKLANVLFTYELARRLGPGSALAVHAIDPGLVDTPIASQHGDALARAVWFFRRRLGETAEAAAANTAFVATSAAAGRATGLYWRAGEPARSSPGSYDPEAAHRLFEISEALTGASYQGATGGSDAR
jgi:NAD(P)-dependent dehydrogenase (short-subunit alcohol dehydrogenase family)